MVQPLALKYRPLRFEDILGQDRLVRGASLLIRKGQLSRNLVIAGSYGTGKTTTARVYGRALNCAEPTPSGSPCGECRNCTMLDADGKGFPDYYEADGASKGGIDEMREVIEIALQPPIFGRRKVIVLDEAQGISKQGFDALLKLTEEPPEHLSLIFLTTEPDKIRPAIRSRCAEFTVTPLDHATSVAHLRHVCESENIRFEDAAIDLLSYLSHGHPRDLMQNLDQVAGMDDVTLAAVKDTFSLGYVHTLVRFGHAMFKTDASALISPIRDWSEAAPRKLERIRQFLTTLWWQHVHRQEVRLDPALTFVPQGDREVVFKAIDDRAAESGILPGDVWQKIQEHWGKVPEQVSEIGLEMALIGFYHLLVTNNLTNSKLPLTEGSAMRKGPQIRRRERQVIMPSTPAQQQVAATPPVAVANPYAPPPMSYAPAGGVAPIAPVAPVALSPIQAIPGIPAAVAPQPAAPPAAPAGDATPRPNSGSLFGGAMTSFDLDDPLPPPVAPVATVEAPPQEVLAAPPPQETAPAHPPAHSFEPVPAAPVVYPHRLGQAGFRPFEPNEITIEDA